MDDVDDVDMFLIDKGYPINPYDKDGTNSVLFYSQKLSVSLVKLLIHYGADINSKSKSGATPLSLALADEHISVVKSLIDGGAYIDSIDSQEYVTDVYNI
eukprot:GHVR01091645.1.p1 GENE.GHVR01091645.1~~GHVR01091645.1.p1  ORF type:complete len:100 (+),score=18.44 GHVR01091645.1:45-344(+)